MTDQFAKALAAVPALCRFQHMPTTFIYGDAVFLLDSQ